MQYIKRTLSQALLQASKGFKAILLTGPRQTGKTTLLENLQKKSRTYISLDDLEIREMLLSSGNNFIIPIC